ncbi:hypothetical protein ScPMuIL_002566 [Solemya velum]
MKTATRPGRVEGYNEIVLQKQLALDVFKGIPYAKPSVGDLRCQRPEPFGNWEEPTRAVQSPNACFQAFGGNMTKLTIIEDSVGAGSVGLHLLSPISRTYFNNAILRSSRDFPITAIGCSNDDIDSMVDCMDGTQPSEIVRHHSSYIDACVYFEIHYKDEVADKYTAAPSILSTIVVPCLRHSYSGHQKDIKMYSTIFGFPFLFIVCTFVMFITSETPPTVETSNGRVEGHREIVSQRQLDVFMGIPYAKPPVGDLRFQRPEPSENWEEPFRAVHSPNACFQVRDDSFNNFKGVQMWNPPGEMNEDCLYLNLWVPQTRSSSGLSTLVWIYGGAFSSGTSTLSIYDGRYLAAKNDVIVASMNYRVGALGFLYSGNQRAPGNMGLLDQALAMKWIYNNIEAFGGNRTKLTIIGESAGAGSVGLHLLSPISRTYFNNAILQSGSPISPWAYLSPHDSLMTTKRFGKALGCPDDDIDSMMDCINGTEPSKIVRHQSVNLDNGFVSTSLPTTDNYFLTDSPSRLLQHGQLKNTKILTGVNKDEYTYFLPYMFPEHFTLHKSEVRNRNEFLNAIESIIPSSTQNRYVLDGIVEEYEMSILESKRRDFEEILADLGGDYAFKCPVIALNREYAELSTEVDSVYFYSFDHRLSNNPWPDWMGVMHGYEIELVFGIPFRDFRNYTDAERALSAHMMKFWTNFAKTGNPNKETDHDRESNQWPSYGNYNQEYIILKTGSTFQTGIGLKHRECSFWNNFYPELFKIEIISWKDDLRGLYFDLNSLISYAGPEKIYKYLRKEGKYKVGIRYGIFVKVLMLVVYNAHFD